MKLVELGTILAMTKGKKPVNQSSEPKDGYLPYVDIETFESGSIKQYTDGTKCTQCEDGDILIVCDGSRSGLVGKAVKGYVGSTLAKISALGLTSDYLYYFVQGKYALLNTRKKGTGTPHLNPELLKKQKLIVPDTKEQERIVSRIEEMFSQLDAGVETLKKTKAQLAIYRQAVLKEAFEDCEEKVVIESVCKYVTDGDHMPPPKEKSGIPFIMISNVEGNIINWKNTAFVGQEYYRNIDIKRKPQTGDVLYTVTGSYGIPILIDFKKDFCFQRHIALLRPNEKVQQKYLYYAMMEPRVYAQATKGATGTAQKTVSLGVLRKMEISYTKDLSHQDEIVSFIEHNLSTCDSIERTIDTALHQAEALRQSILKDAFEGRL